MIVYSYATRVLKVVCKKWYASETLIKQDEFIFKWVALCAELCNISIDYIHPWEAREFMIFLMKREIREINDKKEDKIAWMIGYISSPHDYKL